MRRRDVLLVGILLLFYPRWWRQKNGAALRRSYRDLLVEGDARERGWFRLALWLARDAVVTGLRIRLEGRGRRSTDGIVHEREEAVMTMMAWGVRELGRAGRSLARSPGFALTAILTMGLGIGLNATVLAVATEVLLRPLPYEGAGELVQLENRYLPSGATGAISGAEYWIYRTETSALSASVPVSTDASNLTGRQDPLRVQGLWVGSGFFELLGVPPALGRGFVPEEGAPGGEAVVVLGHALWRDAYGADPDVLGRTIQLGGRSRQVVGVMGPDYTPLSEYLFPGRPEDYYLPLVLDPASFDQRSVERHNLLVLGRLASGVDAQQAEQLLLPAVGRLERAYPGISNESARNVAVASLHEVAVGPVRGALLLLTGAAALVFLVACVNVTSLLLARAEGRVTELGVRAALGAGRGRLVGHGLAESLVIGGLGGVVALGLTLATRSSLASLVPPEVPLPGGALDGLPILLCTVGLAVAAGVLAGTVPAVRIGRGDLFGSIRSGGSDAGLRGGPSLRRGLVVAQIAGAVILVTGAAVLTRSLGELRSVAVGFDAEGLYGLQVSATGAAYPDADDIRALYRGIETQVAELPGIEAVAASWQTPLQNGMSDWPVMPRTDQEAEWVSADPNLVGPGFFEAYGIEILEGRGFEPSDGERDIGPVILNRTGARQLFGGAPAVGRMVNLAFGEPVWREVIGVVEDVRGRGLAQEPGVQTYMTFGEGPFGAISALTLNVRGALDPASLRSEVTEIVHGIDAEIPVGEVQPMESVVAGSVARERVLSALLTVFAAVALALAAIGVYGVVSYTVGRRTREIGLRIAMGARPGSVVGRVVRDGVGLGAIGIILGIGGSLAIGRILEGFVFGISGTDAFTLTSVAAGMLGVVALASLLPARRAAGVDPLQALRGQ